MVSPTDAIPGFLMPVTIYPISPEDKLSLDILSGLNIPTSFVMNFSPAAINSRGVFLETSPPKSLT